MEFFDLLKASCLRALDPGYPEGENPATYVAHININQLRFNENLDLKLKQHLEKMMTEEKLHELEKKNEDVEVSPTFASPAGDAATAFLDKQFTLIEEWVKLKLKDGITKTILLSQLEFIYQVVRAAVVRALD